MAVPAPATASAYEQAGPPFSAEEQLTAARAAQRLWVRVPLAQRLKMLREFRHLLATEADRVTPLIAGTLARTEADTLSAEVLPLAEAVRFLEIEAPSLLAVEKPDNRARPFWLGGVQLQVQRDPWGVVLVIGPSNYPLFLPAVQAIQALAAGNAVCWKPGQDASAVAWAMADLLARSGLPGGLLTITGESVEAAQKLIATGVDKIVMTGSESSGRAVLRAAAETLTPATIELSGCDAMFVLSDADLDRSVAALLFGLRFNGSSTCIAPRRVFVHATIAEPFRRKLMSKLGTVPAVGITERTRALVEYLHRDAVSRGATLLSGRQTSNSRMTPMVLGDVKPEMEMMRTDVFAPLIGLCSFGYEQQALAMAEECPYALGATVFGGAARAVAFARQVQGGLVVVNDMIAPTADPRISFGGRRSSGFGKSRGAEGLLEMTVSKTVVVRTSGRLRHLEPPHPQAQAIFSGFSKVAHGRGFMNRARSLFTLGKILVKKTDSANS